MIIQVYSGIMSVEQQPPPREVAVQLLKYEIHSCSKLLGMVLENQENFSIARRSGAISMGFDKFAPVLSMVVYCPS